MMPQTATKRKNALAMPPNGESTMEGVPRGRFSFVWVPPGEREKTAVLKGKPPAKRAVFANRNDAGSDTIAVKVAEEKTKETGKPAPKEDEAGDFAREGIMRSFGQDRAALAFHRRGPYAMG